jgi:hypothetical protein
MLVIPCDPLRRRKPDEHFAAEYEAADALGLQVGLVDHDALAAGDAATAVTGIDASDDVMYRGWMLSSASYAAFDLAMSERGCLLRTSADAYRAAHELPGWFEAVKTFTAETVWTNSSSLDELDGARRRLVAGPAMIRDFVKSEKHYWDEAAFIPDVTDSRAARAVATRLRQLRAGDFTGGFVLRRFEVYVSSEARTWWIDGRCAMVTAHPDTPDTQPEGFVEPPGLAHAISSIGLPFVTADLAQREDGVWRLIEIGDGQVSDRPRSTDSSALLKALIR